MNNIKQPLFITLVCAAAITVLGASLGWFGIENELIRSLAENELAKKETLAIGLSAACVGIAILVAKLDKKRFAFLATILSIYELTMIINQKPEDALARQIGVSVEAGYWLSLIGTLVVIIASGIIGAKGFKIVTKNT